MAAYVERRAACGASYNACASGATPCNSRRRSRLGRREKRGRTVNFNAELGCDSGMLRTALAVHSRMACMPTRSRCEEHILAPFVMYYNKQKEASFVFER